MELRFISKENSSTEESSSTTALYNFLVNNLKYLRLVLNMMSKNKFKLSPKKTKRAIERNIKCDNSIKKSSNYEDFVEIMQKFYNKDSNQKLNEQRGILLEKLWCYNGPYYYNQLQFRATKEAQVYLNGEFFENYENDIDVVYEILNESFTEDSFNDYSKYLKCVELDECKSSAENATQDPMCEGNKRKFELMEKTKKKILTDEEELGCRAHIITYDGNSQQTEYWLKTQGFNDIEIICRETIEKRILNK